MDSLSVWILLRIIRLDVGEKRIPDELNLMLLLLAVFKNPFWARDGLISLILALLLYVASGHRLGLGDVKLYGALSAQLGLEHLWMLYALSFLSAGLVCLLLLLTKKISPQDEIAFGPFIALAWFLIKWPILRL